METKRHEWQFSCLYQLSGSPVVRELLRCVHCDQEKLGIARDARPGEHGVTGPYNVWNERDTCPTAVEIEERLAEHSRFAAGNRAAREAALAARREDVQRRAFAAGVPQQQLPFSREEAEALYRAGYASGSERGADGGSFEAAVRDLGRP